VVAKVAIISITIVVLVLIALGTGIYLARRQERIQARRHGYAMRGDLNRSEEQALVTMLAEAADIFRGLGQNTSEYQYLDDIEILRANTKIDVGRWLARYDNTKEKISK
jgi:hypothetical protein